MASVRIEMYWVVAPFVTRRGRTINQRFSPGLPPNGKGFVMVRHCHRALSSTSGFLPRSSGSMGEM